MKTLKTDRLILRQWKLKDLDDLYNYARNPKVGPNAGWQAHTSREASMKVLSSFMEKEEVWAVEYKADKKVIGSIGAHPDVIRSGINSRMVGYVLSEDYWGKGLMTEAVKAVIRYLFQKEKYDIVSCYHYPHNIRSKRVIEKCGFKYEGILRSASQIYDGTIYDLVCYSILRDEYFVNGG